MISLKTKLNNAAKIYNSATVAKEVVGLRQPGAIMLAAIHSLTFARRAAPH
jgi:hypothetical protein